MKQPEPASRSGSEGIRFDGYTYTFDEIEKILKDSDSVGRAFPLAIATVAIEELRQRLAAERRQYVQCSEALNRVCALSERGSSDAEDAARWRDACLDPIGYAHLFNLLAAGKGTVESLNKMADRIGVSRRNAIDAGRGPGPIQPLKGAVVPQPAERHEP